MDKEIVKEVISKSDFWRYENCRRSGVTNMFDVRVVEMLTGLPKAKLILIMQNYKELKAKYVEE